MISRTIRLLPSSAGASHSHSEHAASQADFRTRSVEEIAKKRGISMAQVAMAWVLSKSGVSAPIVGSTSLANLEDIISESRSSLHVSNM